MKGLHIFIFSNEESKRNKCIANKNTFIISTRGFPILFIPYSEHIIYTYIHLDGFHLIWQD
jgi:hypothetical protein